jgi:hypothetical protein
MKNKKIVGIVMITVIVSVLVYLFKDKIKAMLPQPASDPSDPTTEPTGESEPSDPATGDAGTQVYDAEGCGGNYTNNLDEISEHDPASNVGGCGSAVVAWQEYLNTVMPTNIPLVVDGKYGSATLNAHLAYLSILPTVSRDIVAPLYEQGSGSAVRMN